MAGDINRAYQLVIQACNDPNIGYSQARRRTISLGQTYQTYCDCSSLLSWALTLAGFYANNPWFATSNERAQLLQAGFHEVNIDSEWKQGDILWRTGHTEMVYRGRVTMGAHTDGILFADQVSINKYADRPANWTSCYRYQDGASGDEPGMNISLQVVCAIVGNWFRESQVNPGIWESLTVGSGGYGLGQWTGDRRVDLFNWLDDNGYQRGDGDGQIKYFFIENDWQASSSSPLKFNTLEEFLTTSNTDIDALTETFMNAWERPGVPALEDRQAFAHKAYDYILAHQGDHITWVSKNEYISEPESLNNSVRVYQQLGLGSKPDGFQGWSNLLRYGAFRELYRRKYICR